MNPELSETSKELHDHEMAKWKTIIQNSMDQGEVQADVDVEKTARLFMSVRHGIGMTSTFNESMEETIDNINEMYQYVFSLIRTK